MVLADFKVFYSTLRYRRLWCVSVLTICFESDKNCHLVWGTKRYNIIFIKLHTFTSHVLLYAEVIDVFIAVLQIFYKFWNRGSHSNLSVFF